MTSPFRRLALTTHVTTSVGWLGAIVVFLAFALDGLASASEVRVRADYLAMDLMTWRVIVPLAVTSFVTGVISSLGTAWGLFRHYWVLLKLLITVLATAVLIMHLEPIRDLGAAAAIGALGPDVYQARTLMVFAACAAAISLIVLTTLSVYKPRGMTPYGWRRQHADGPG